MFRVCKNINHFSEVIYYIGLSAYIFASTLKISMLGQAEIIQNFITVSRFFGVITCFFSIFFRKNISLKFLLFIISITLTFILVMLKIDDHGGLLMFLVMVGAWKCNSFIIAKIHLFFAGIVFILGIIGSQIGIVEDRIFYFYRSSTNVFERHSLGMTYCTTFASLSFFLFGTYLFLKKKKLGIIEMLILILLTFVIYYFSRSRLELLMTLFMIACYVKLSFFKKLFKYKTVNFLISNIFLLTLVITLLLSLIYKTDPFLFKRMNDIFTGRLDLVSQAIDTYGFSLFGESIPMQGGGSIDFDSTFGYFFIDAFYMNWLLVYGCILMFLLILFFHWIIKILVLNRKYKIVILVSFACFHGIIISAIMQPQINPFFLMALAEASCCIPKRKNYEN